jgi:hypothetical protein
MEAQVGVRDGQPVKVTRHGWHMPGDPGEPVARAQVEPVASAPVPAAPGGAEPPKVPPVARQKDPNAPKIEYVRAAAGGQVSEIDGKFYRGGQLMPVHGKYSGMEKPPKGDGLSVGTPVQANPDSEGGGGGRGGRAPQLTPEERRARAEAQSKWQEMQTGPLGRILWLGDSPNRRATSEPSPVLDKWREFAAEIGPAGVQHIVNTLEPQLHSAIDSQVAKLREGSSPPDADAEQWYKDDVKRRAGEYSTYGRSKKHEREVPGSHYARELVYEMMQQGNAPGDRVDVMHRMNALLKEAAQVKVSPESAPVRTPDASAPAPAAPGGAEPPKVPPVASTPRAEAETAAASAASDYEFARQSGVPNVGEDIRGSARHIRNEWRGLEDAEKNGTAAEMVTREQLFRNEPHALTATIKPDTALSHLAAHIALDGFPAAPFKAKELEDYRRRAKEIHDRNPDMNPGRTDEELRRQYYDAYTAIKSAAETLSQLHTKPGEFVAKMREVVKQQIDKARDKRANAYGVENEHDWANPVASALVALHNTRLSYSSAKPTSVLGRIKDFAKRIKDKYGEADFGANAQKHALDVLEGDSFNKTFGTVAGGPKRFDPSTAYIGTATRKGGRVIDASTVQAATGFLSQGAGFRGLQFGNSVSDDERQHHLRHTSEAVADLSDVTGLPDSAISLKGSLGIAFGARGKGAAMAHYEPSLKVINLTRKKGVGTLAHEWGHALDHFLGGGGKTATGSGKGTTDYLSADPRDAAGDAVRAAMKEVRDAVRASGFEDRARAEFAEMQKRGEVPEKQDWRTYWGSSPELFARAFEKHVSHELRAAGRENTYLSGLKDHGLWPSRSESAAMAPAFQKLFAAVKSKHFDGEGATVNRTGGAEPPKVPPVASGAGAKTPVDAATPARDDAPTQGGVAGMPRLRGTPKQVDYADRLRAQFLAKLTDYRPEELGEDASNVAVLMSHLQGNKYLADADFWLDRKNEPTSFMLNHIANSVSIKNEDEGEKIYALARAVSRAWSARQKKTV